MTTRRLPTHDDQPVQAYAHSPRWCAPDETAVPDIVCPSWCIVSRAKHARDLADLEGRVVHRSADLAEEGAWSMNWVVTTHPDGSPFTADGDRAAGVYVEVDGGLLTFEAAASLARALDWADEIVWGHARDLHWPPVKGS